MLTVPLEIFSVYTKNTSRCEVELSTIVGIRQLRACEVIHRIYVNLKLKREISEIYPLSRGRSFAIIIISSRGRGLGRGHGKITPALSPTLSRIKPRDTSKASCAGEGVDRGEIRNLCLIKD